VGLGGYGGGHGGGHGRNGGRDRAPRRQARAPLEPKGKTGAVATVYRVAPIGKRVRGGSRPLFPLTLPGTTGWLRRARGRAMIAIQIKRLDQTFRVGCRPAPAGPHHPTGEFVFSAGPERVRQNDLVAQPSPGFGHCGRGPDLLRRRGCHAPGASPGGHGHGVPKLRLWPHMTVAENVAFGLEERDCTGGDIPAPGGRRARFRGTWANTADANQPSCPVAATAGRPGAGARDPAALPLLDEPLSNRTPNWGSRMRAEDPGGVCKDFQLTTVYVTHDQKEALSMADRNGHPRRGGEHPTGGDAARCLPAARSENVANFVGETDLSRAGCSAPRRARLGRKPPWGDSRRAGDRRCRPRWARRLWCRCARNAGCCRASAPQNCVAGSWLEQAYLGRDGAVRLCVRERHRVENPGK